MLDRVWLLQLCLPTIPGQHLSEYQVRILYKMS